MRYGRVAGIVLGAGALILIGYVMANGIGLVDGLDFGAGAYYYADIPEFDKLTASTTDFGDSSFAVIAFFVIWSIIVLGLLMLVKAIPRPSDEGQDSDDPVQAGPRE
ncbi:MAG: hypothetical protein PUK31_05690 [Candidatus Methanomethylophilaceae archaeon]|nr:hypothetical protein [Candidatus Methanomethylophilaceae archaeon]